GKAPAQAGIGGLNVLAEPQHDAPLVRIDGVEAARQPYDADQRGKGTEPATELARRKIGHARTGSAAIAGAAASLALGAEQAGKALIEIAPDFLEVGRPLIAAAIVVAAPAVAAIAIVAALAAPAWVVK